MKTNIQLAIADDQRLFLKGMRFIIDTFENIDLIIEAYDGQDLINKLASTTPDVVLLDLKMPVMDGIETTKHLKIHYPDLKIILLTMHNDERLISYMMELGVNGYLLKDEEPEQVKKAIESVMKKDFFFNEYVSKALLKGVKGKHKNRAPSVFSPTGANLTKRELEILQLICQERTTAEIASQLFISTRTVEGHRKNLLEKTNVRNMAGLVIYAMKNQLVTVL